MNLIDDFDDISTDDDGYILITDEEIADLTYSLIDDEGAERLIPLRWHSFDVSDSNLNIIAKFDRPVGEYTEMSVLFDHLNRETSVELVDEYGSTNHLCWDMSSDTRVDLYHAVRFLTFLTLDTNVVREWPSGTNPADRMESL